MSGWLSPGLQLKCSLLSFVENLHIHYHASSGSGKASSEQTANKEDSDTKAPSKFRTGPVVQTGALLAVLAGAWAAVRHLLHGKRAAGEDAAATFCLRSFTLLGMHCACLNDLMLLLCR